MSKFEDLRGEMAIIEEASLDEATREISRATTELSEIVDAINATAGYQKATLHRGELMKPAMDIPPWGVAYMDAVREVYALCRPSSNHWQGPQLGDWFNLTRNIPTTALPSALKIGVSQGYTLDFKKRTPAKQRFCMIRLPLARFWHPAWRPIINQAMIGSSSDA
jgi:hypothetical protein